MVLWILVIGTTSQVLSMFILWSFHFSSLGHHPRFYLTLFVCSFGFLSLGRHHRFYLGLFLFHLLSHHWNTIFRSYLSLFLASLIYHHWDVILMILSHFILCSFRFSSLGCHLRFYLKLNYLFVFVTPQFFFFLLLLLFILQLNNWYSNTV